LFKHIQHIQLFNLFLFFHHQAHSSNYGAVAAVGIAVAGASFIMASPTEAKAAVDAAAVKAAIVTVQLF
jgi:hypothetical protein